MERGVIITLSLIAAAMMVIPGISIAVAPAISSSGQLGVQVLIISVTDQNGRHLGNVSVQGVMTLPPQDGNGFKTVFVGKTNPGGKLVLTNLEKVLNVSNAWLTYQGAGLAVISSPSIMLMLTYVGTNGTYFGESAVQSNTTGLLHGKSYHAYATINLDKKPQMPLPDQSGAQSAVVYKPANPNSSQQSATPASIGGQLPCLTFSGGYEWVLCSNTEKSSQVENLPIAWISYSGPGHSGGTVDTALFQASTSYLNAGFAIGAGSSLGSVKYQAGATIWQTSSTGALLQNSQTVPNSCNGNSAYVYYTGQVQGAEYEAWLVGPCYSIPCNTYMYQAGIYNLQSAGNSWGTPDSTFMSYVNQNYYTPEVACIGSSSSYQSQTIYSPNVVNEFAASDTQWINVGIDVGALALAFIPGVDVVSAVILASMVASVSYGSTDTSVSMANTEIWSDAGYGVLAEESVSNTNWQMANGQTGSIPIEGVTLDGYQIASSGGGGGCVLYGTNITLANGTTIPVQDLRPGMKTLSFDTSSGQLLNSTVNRVTETNVSTIVQINHNIGISGLGDQPVFVKLQNGTTKWVVLGQVNYTMQIFNPINQSWTPVKSLIVGHGNFSVYDVVTSKQIVIDGHSRVIDDYIANGVLLDIKITG